MRHSKNTRRDSGFSLMEVLIVVALIAILVAIAMPAFATQMENARESQDKEAARAAVAAASSAYKSSFRSGEFAYVYDGTKAVPASEADGVTGYGQSQKPATYMVSGVTVTGTPNEDGSPNFVCVTIGPQDPSDASSPVIPTAIEWGISGFKLYSKIKGTTIEDGAWYQHSQTRQETFEELQNTAEAQRKAADIQILEALANHFDGMSAADMESILGGTRYAQAQGSGSMMFEYGQDGGGSIRFNSFDTDNQGYFKKLGYDPRIYITSGTWREVDHFVGRTSGGSDVYNYVNKYLFTSEEMLGSNYKAGTFHQIWIKFKIVDGKVSNPRVWVKNLDAQGFNSDNR